MDVVMLEKPSAYVLYLPFVVVLFGLMQGVFNYAATYWNTWVGRKISNDVKLVLFEKLMKNDPPLRQGNIWPDPVPLQS